MKSEPIYIKPGTYAIAGTAIKRYVEGIESHINRLQVLLGDELNAALAAMGEAAQSDPATLISFTGAFTGMSTLLNLCFYARGIIALEDGMETVRDRQMVEGVRKILVPLLLGQGDLLRTSLVAHQDVRDPALRSWYLKARAELDGICNLVGRLA